MGKTPPRKGVWSMRVRKKRMRIVDSRERKWRGLLCEGEKERRDVGITRRDR